MPSCHSTNDISAELISKDKVQDGTIVITDHQIKGRGQGSGNWESEKGLNLTLSLILKTGFLPVNRQFYLNIIACLSLWNMLKQYLNSGIQIKWPNDIYYRDKKICGILIQNILKGDHLEYSIIGMGININQQKFSIPNAVSLQMITGRWYNLESVLERLSEALEKYYNYLIKGQFDDLKKMYLKQLMWLNEVHTFQAETLFEGRIIDIDETGRLLVQANGSVRAFNFREVKFVN